MTEPSDPPSSVSLLIGKSRMESIGADVDMTLATYVSRVTAYNLAVDLNTGDSPDHGKLKKIYNETAGDVVINSSINVQSAGTDTITLSAGGWIELVYLNDPDITERYREIDGVDYVLS